MEILSPKAIAYAEDCQEELEQLLLALCRIPAPSHQEDQRASFCRDWFIQAGGKDTYIDEAKNVVCPWHLTEDKPVVVFMAHTDTVFPDLTPFEPVVTDERISCPGVGDDTANLAVLMLAARYIMQNELPIGCGVLFVANSCEEGLGNLKGSRQLLKDYGSRIRAVISFDGYLEGITHQAVGSHRYRVEIRTPGGHSYASFGKPNAIHLLSELIHTLYQVKIPEGMGYTTYNVGCIEAGHRSIPSLRMLRCCMSTVRMTGEVFSLCSRRLNRQWQIAEKRELISESKRSENVPAPAIQILE